MSAYTFVQVADSRLDSDGNQLRYAKLESGEVVPVLPGVWEEMTDSDGNIFYQLADEECQS